MGHNVKTLANISYDRLDKEIIELCKRLKIPGSYGSYSLYSAIFTEKQKADNERAFWKDYNKKIS